MPSGFISDEKKDVRVEVVRCKAVIPDHQSKAIKFRAADPSEHDNYACFWKPPEPHPDKRESWRLIMSDPDDPDEEATCLSLVRFNVLSRLPSHCDVGATFLDAFRRASGGGGATAEGQMRGSTATSAYGRS